LFVAIDIGDANIGTKRAPASPHTAKNMARLGIQFP